MNTFWLAQAAPGFPSDFKGGTGVFPREIEETDAKPPFDPGEVDAFLLISCIGLAVGLVFALFILLVPRERRHYCTPEPPERPLPREPVLPTKRHRRY